VAAFLRAQVMPRLDGQLAFHVRVAANMLDLAMRQIRLAPAAERDELIRLRALLAADGGIAELNRELCRRIDDGRFTLHTPGLTEHLWRTTLDKLAVDQPGYETLVRLLAGDNNKDA
jgi:hypothetical protein